MICRYMYFSTAGASPRIFRADMDGKNKIVLANLSLTGRSTVDMVVDKRGNRLFFTDQSNGAIRYIDLKGMEIHALLSGNLHRPTGITMLNNTLYWTAKGDGKFSGAIFKSEATSGSTAHMIAHGFHTDVKAILAHSSLAFQQTGNWLI